MNLYLSVRSGRFLQTMTLTSCQWVWMKPIWISLTTWNKGRAGQNPHVHIATAPAALLQAGLNISINIIYCRHDKKHFTFHTLEIHLIIVGNNLFSVQGKRRLSFSRRQCRRRRTSLRSCLRTARAPLPACRSLNKSVLPVVRSRYLGSLLRRLWERCVFVSSRRPCWLPVQVRGKPPYLFFVSVLLFSDI